MRYGAFATRARYRDLEVVIDYRTYDGEWTTWVRAELVAATAEVSWDMRVCASLVARRASTTAASGNAFASW